MIQLYDTVLVKTRLVAEAPWNPNDQEAEIFNALVESIEDIGMVENVALVKVGALSDHDRERLPEGTEYIAVSGNHRVRAAFMLDPDGEIPAVVLSDDIDIGKLKAITVRMNVIRGKLDPVKFTQLFNEVADDYGREIAKSMMGFANEKAFERLYQEAKHALPPQVQTELEKSKDELKTVDDLATVLNTLFTRYGDTLDHSYMVFVWGGQPHLMIRTESQLRGTLKVLQDECASKDIDMNDVLRDVIIAGMKATSRE